MNKKTFRIAAVLCTAASLMGVTAASAGAATLAPSSQDFGSQTVGTSSGTQGFILTNGCSATGPGGACIIPQFTSPAVATSGDFTQTNDCGFLLTTNGQTCTVFVKFAPTAVGSRSGTLTTGGGTATLTGTGLAAKDSGTGAKKKKCKKKSKKRAAAAKKKGCKKKKK